MSLQPWHFLVLAPAIAACGSQQTRTKSRGTATSGSAKIKTRTALSHPAALGISGACQRGSDIYLVGERNHTLLRRSQAGKIHTFPITGVPKGLDLEGLACSESSLYISTESEVPGRTSDLVLKLQIRGEQAVVTEQIEMHYPPGVLAGDNHGLEGVCIADDWLIASGELVRETKSGIRQAPILQRKLTGGPTLVDWVTLTSKTGKLSGLDCRKGESGAIEIFAIERHFDVARVLRAQVGPKAEPGHILLALEGILRDSENFEALIVAPNGGIRLYNDNQYKTITGPSEEVALVPLSAFAASTTAFPLRPLD